MLFLYMTDSKYYYINKVFKGYRGSRLLVALFGGREITDLIIAEIEHRPSGPVLVVVESVSKLYSISETEK